MPASPFLDTNVLIYAVARNDPRAEIAEALLTAGGVVSVQVFNEFAATARRTLDMSWDDIAEALDAIRILCPSPRALSIETHDAAVTVARTHGFHMYDALIVASALAAGCETLYTEDLQDGQVIDQRLTIRNPFTACEVEPLPSTRCAMAEAGARLSLQQAVEVGPGQVGSHAWAEMPYCGVRSRCEPGRGTPSDPRTSATRWTFPSACRAMRT